MFLLFTFYRHPEHFYEFCKHFNIDHCKPTKTHLFISFLYSKNILLRVFTQNVDGLEKKAGLPKKFLVNAHGVIDEAHCPKCRTDVDFKLLKEYVMRDEILYCPTCKSPCKPKVVFYGENLPYSFSRYYNDIFDTDLAFIIGTSLKVYPFGDLAYDVPLNAMRVVINNEMIGKWFGSNKFDFNNPDKNDLFLLGISDNIIEQIVKDCEWSDEFNSYCKKILDNLM